jgi:hypothetical protein
MKLKPFQTQDLARAALHDGLILSWDTGLGKTWALFLWPLLKVRFHPEGDTIVPNAPVLIIAPGDLHKQIADEGWNHFRVRVQTLDSQETFIQLTRQPNSALTHQDASGRPVLPPAFYITSYTQLASNGVQKLPDPDDYPDPVALQQHLCLPTGTHVPLAAQLGRHDIQPEFSTVCEFYAHRATRFAEPFDLLGVSPADTLAVLESSLAAALEKFNHTWMDPKFCARQKAALNDAAATLRQLLSPQGGDTPFARLRTDQQHFILRAFLRHRLTLYAAHNGQFKPDGSADSPSRGCPNPFEPDQWEPNKASPQPSPHPLIQPSPHPLIQPSNRIKCLYSPSLSDLCYNAFDAVVIDEGVKMKGEDTLVGRGVRQMEPKYRLVLTATPVKNRLPDVFRLAWWASGGKTAAHARWPYADDSTERQKFAETFMVTERNLSKEKAAQAKGEKISGGRFKKLTPEVCNVHKLWKLFGPIVLRRRKQDTGIDIVPKLRKVIRCELGTQQKRVYRYHLNADYQDINGNKAVGAQLQALRMAAADPSSEHLQPVAGANSETCPACRGSGCPSCHETGAVPLPYRSASPFVPKMATALTLLAEILERREQVIVFSAFNDPLDHLSRWLDQAGVRHTKLDGRVSQKQRGLKAAVFKQGRADQSSLPVTLAGVECMAEGHSFHLANNVILIAYSWAADKFKQALDRVHRMNSVKPVNIYVVLCAGTIDRKLESLTDEKSDAAELVLDGRLIGERPDEINLAQLLNLAREEFNTQDQTVDESLLQRQWPDLRARLARAMAAWDEGLPASFGAPPSSPPRGGRADVCIPTIFTGALACLMRQDDAESSESRLPAAPALAPEESRGEGEGEGEGGTYPAPRERVRRVVSGDLWSRL